MIELHTQLERLGVFSGNLLHNGSTAELYEAALKGHHAVLTESGALLVESGSRKGRSPADKRIVENPESQHEISWGEVNYPLRPMSYRMNRRRAIDYLNQQERLYVVDGFSSWDQNYRLKVRLVAARPDHALFLKNMLVRPSEEECANFGEPDFTILNAGAFPADPLTPDVTTPVSVNLNLEAREMVILGTEYAGEMEKGIFSVMNHLLPPRNVLTLHCAANEGPRGDVTLFVGLSGTGKTSLATDANRRLIGDDEHGWSDEGIFNLEGGCYAKCANLTQEFEPTIYESVRFGCVLENCVLEQSILSSRSRCVNFSDVSLTENTRASFPIHSVRHAKTPCIAGHPANIVFLTCDAFGVFPPVSRLTSEQASFHFLNGYTSKVAETEIGVCEPQATFSACYGAAFLTRHPNVYADLLAERLREHQPQLWLVNTGWTGGDFQLGHRIPIEDTRAIIDAIHSADLDDVPYEIEPIFGLEVPTRCPGVSSQRLMPRKAWKDMLAYDSAACQLKEQFARNFGRIEHAPVQFAGHTASYHRTGI